MVKTDFSTDISWKNFPNSWKENRYNGEKKCFLVYQLRNSLQKKKCLRLSLVLFQYHCFTYTQDIDHPILEFSKRSSLQTHQIIDFKNYLSPTFDSSQIICPSFSLLVLFFLFSMNSQTWSVVSNPIGKHQGRLAELCPRPPSTFLGAFL